MLHQEPWTFEYEAFDGARALSDSCDAVDEAAMAVCLARVLVVRVVANAVHRQIRSEDLREDVAGTRLYLGEMLIPEKDARVFDRLLGALTPYDPDAITEQLLAASVLALARHQEGSARGLAELAYEAAAAHRRDEGAHGAALALARIASMQEAPWNARKWRAIARMHVRQAIRRRFAGV
jgi:hypothetical protein